jgi:hypothetical protein
LNLGAFSRGLDLTWQVHDIENLMTEAIWAVDSLAKKLIKILALIKTESRLDSEFLAD